MNHVSVIATNLNMRSAPSVEHGRIKGQVTRGMVLPVVEEVEKWLLVIPPAAVIDPSFDPDPTRLWVARLWTTPYLEPFAGRNWPTRYNHITQPYGANKTYYRTFGLDGHEGLDIRAPQGSPIYAIEAGRVKMIATNPLPKAQGGHNYGIHLRIGHVDAYESIYAHLETASVELGDLVSAGQQIGTADNTGNSFGSHLHITLKHRGRIIDPTPHLANAEIPNSKFEIRNEGTS